MRVRFEFRKEDQARFISHLDMIRVFERSARRAGLQISYSQGFNPHPKIAFGPALALGVSSRSEYVDISFDEEMAVEDYLKALGKNLPSGVSILAAAAVPDGAEALNALIARAEYVITCDSKKQISQKSLEELCQALMDKDEIMIKKRTKKGIQDRDIRKGIFSLKGKIKDNRIVLEMELAAGPGGAVRPEQVLEVLVSMGLPVDGQHRDIERTGLYSWDGESRRTPLQVLSPSERSDSQ